MADVTSTTATTTTTTTSTTTAVNPDSILDKDDFLTLLLTELQYQDPTSPMETEKILEQTTQLATLESQQSTNDLMEELVSKLQVNQNYGAINAIGKMAELKNELEVTGGESIEFDLYFDKEIKSGTVEILDASGNTIDTIDLDSTTAGTKSFSWDGTDSSGVAVEDGTYSIEATYASTDNETYQTAYGTYKISSIKFDGDEAYVKLGDEYVSLSEITEIYE